MCLHPGTPCFSLTKVLAHPPRLRELSAPHARFVAWQWAKLLVQMPKRHLYIGEKTDVSFCSERERTRFWVVFFCPLVVYTCQCSEPLVVAALEAWAFTLCPQTFASKFVLAPLLVDWRPLLLGARTLLVAPGLTTRNKKEATCSKGHRY